MRFHFDSEEEERSEIIGEAAVDTPNHYDFGEGEDQEITLRVQNDNKNV